MSSPYFATGMGLVLERTSECTCAYPDCGGYCVHEPHCGLIPVGQLPYLRTDDPELLPSMLWDFSDIDHRIGHDTP